MTIRMLVITLLAASLSFAQTAAAPAKAKVAAPAAALLDINTATLEELEAMAGIGTAYAEKIVQGRPYRVKTELLQKKVLPQATYNKIKNKIVARQK